MANPIDYVKVKAAAERLVWLITDLSYKAPEVRPDHDYEIVANAATIADEAGVSKNIAAFLGVPKLTDDMLGTEREVERLENVLRYIGANCEDPETVRDNVSRALRGKSVP